MWIKSNLSSLLRRSNTEYILCKYKESTLWIYMYFAVKNNLKHGLKLGFLRVWDAPPAPSLPDIDN